MVNVQTEGVQERAERVRKDANASVRPVLISSTDYMGGASRSAYRLHDGLRRLGCESRMFVGAKYRSDPDVVSYRPTTNMRARVKRMVRQVWLERQANRYLTTSPAARTLYADDRTRWGDDFLAQIPQADVIHLHWIGGFVDYGAFFGWLPTTMPLAFTLHDMANFTGGCCFDLECGKFMKGCGACPQLGSRDNDDLTSRVWRRKKRFYAGLRPERVRVVAPCTWLANEAKRSELLGRFECAAIPNGLDMEVFQPRERHAARELAGVPMDATVVLFMADNINQYRKGFHLLAQALEQIGEERELFLLSIGKDPTPELGRFRHVHIDDLTNDRTLSFIYSAADIFVLPSLADNFPNTALEAIACGIPVAAFDSGGVPEMVRPGVTGWLAPRGDVTMLKEAMVRLLDDPAKRAEMSANCRRVATTEYDVVLQAKRYIQVYEDVSGALS